jgi:ATPase MipZ
MREIRTSGSVLLHAWRASEHRTTPLSCVQLADGRLPRAQLAALAAKHDDTVIDVGGRDSAALRAALSRADLLVVPVQPRAVDVWALSDIADLIEQAQAARADDGKPSLRVVAVLNLADPGTNHVEAPSYLMIPASPAMNAGLKAPRSSAAFKLTDAEAAERLQDDADELD